MFRNVVSLSGNLPAETFGRNRMSSLDVGREVHQVHDLARSARG